MWEFFRNKLYVAINGKFWRTNGAMGQFINDQESLLDIHQGKITPTIFYLSTRSQRSMKYCRVVTPCQWFVCGFITASADNSPQYTDSFIDLWGKIFPAICETPGSYTDRRPSHGDNTLYHGQMGR